MTFAQKLVYFIDKWTPFFAIVELQRAKWFSKTFPVQQWLKDAKNLLDVGSGVGDVTNVLVKQSSAEVTGIDIVDFRRKDNKKNITFKFYVADAQILPFPDSSFDCVTIFWLLHHLPYPEKALKEALRVLQKGGSLLILEDLIFQHKPIRNSLIRFYDRLVNLEFFGNPHQNRTLKDWNELIEKCGDVEMLESATYPWCRYVNFFDYGLLRYKKI